MPRFDDFEIQRLDAEEPPPGRSTRVWYRVAALALVLAVVSFLAVRTWRRAPAPADDQTRVETEEPVGAGQGLGAPAEPVDLPSLADSDAFVRKLVAGLSSHPRLAAWLVPDNLIDRLAASVDNIADGTRPVTHLRPLAPTGPFLVSGNAAELAIDPRSYDRYNLTADVVASIDARGAARLYSILKPLIQEAYRQLGYPDGRFDETLARGMRRLIDTPVPPDHVLVMQHEANYLYVDSSLEARSPIEKQFMRMGPRNIRLIQAKLREIARELGM